MAAPTVIMRPVVNWNRFDSGSIDIGESTNEMAFIYGGKSAGTVRDLFVADINLYTYNQLPNNITNHVYRDGRFYRPTTGDFISQVTGTPTAQILTGAYLPGSDDVYVYVCYYEAAASSLTFLHAPTAVSVPSVVSATEIHSKNTGGGIWIKCYKITTSNDFIFVSHRIGSAANIRSLNIHFFRGDDAYVFDQVNDKIVFAFTGGHNQNFAWLSTNIPYTPYSGSELLVPYYYDDNADLLTEMGTVSPSSSDNAYGYSMVFQFNGQHYGPTGVNLWDDNTMSERQSKMFTENVVGIWRPGQADASRVPSHTRAKSATDPDGYNASLATDTDSNKSYLIGLLNELWSNNTDINPAQSGQESPVINLDYSYV